MFGCSKPWSLLHQQAVSDQPDTVFEMDELKNAIIKIQNGEDNLKKWENKDKMAIVKMIDKFIETNW